jgi:signal peptidase II
MDETTEMSTADLWKARARYIGITIAVVVLNYGLDRLTKLLAIEFLKGRPPVSFFGDLMVLVYAENSGAFLSMGSVWSPFLKYLLFLVIPGIVCLYGLFWCFLKARDLPRIVLVATIIGGGAGNMVDRIANDFRVVDFLNFGIGRLRTGVLNVADLSVTFGALLLVFVEHRREKREQVTGSAGSA